MYIYIYIVFITLYMSSATRPNYFYIQIELSDCKFCYLTSLLLHASLPLFAGVRIRFSSGGYFTIAAVKVSRMPYRTLGTRPALVQLDIVVCPIVLLAQLDIVVYAIVFLGRDPPRLSSISSLSNSL